jgi:hypothetical protein
MNEGAFLGPRDGFAISLSQYLGETMNDHSSLGLAGTILLLTTATISIAQPQPIQMLAPSQSQPAQNLPLSGASARVTDLNPKTNSATVRITNTSSKDITAFTVIVIATYADGTEERDERMVDFLWSMLAHRKYGDSAGSVFGPGQSQEIIAGFSAKESNAIDQITAHLAAVVYADQTAQVLEEEPFGRILDNRRGSILAKQRAMATFRQALVDPANPHPIAEASRKLKDIQNEEKTAPSGALQLEFQPILQDLDRLSQRTLRSKSSGAQFLHDYMDEMEEEIRAVALHCQLRRLP